MPPPFSFMTATEIVFGRGVSAEMPARIAALSRRVLLVQGASRARSEAFAASLEAAGPDPRRQLLALFDSVDEWRRSPDFRGGPFTNACR